MEITNVNPNKNYESLECFNRSRSPFQNFNISLPQDQTGSVYLLTSQKVTSYVHIGSTLCLITTLRKYNRVGYESGTDIAMHLSQFVLIAYICDFIKDRQIIEYTKDQWIGQQHHYVLQ